MKDCPLCQIIVRAVRYDQNTDHHCTNQKYSVGFLRHSVICQQKEIKKQNYRKIYKVCLHQIEVNRHVIPAFSIQLCKIQFSAVLGGPRIQKTSSSPEILHLRRRSVSSPSLQSSVRNIAAPKSNVASLNRSSPLIYMIGSSGGRLRMEVAASRPPASPITTTPV